MIDDALKYRAENVLKSDSASESLRFWTFEEVRTKLGLDEIKWSGSEKKLVEEEKKAPDSSSQGSGV